MSSRTGGHLFRTGAKRDLLTAHSGLDAHFRAQRNLARALRDALAHAEDPDRCLAKGALSLVGRQILPDTVSTLTGLSLPLTSTRPVDHQAGEPG